MAFFKFRKGDDASAPSVQSSQGESVEAMRKRARQRLIGAAVLVLLGVIGFPLVFDTQPRPIAVDIPIDIPDRAKARAPGAPTAAVGAVAVAPAAAPEALKSESAVVVPSGAAPATAAVAPVTAPAAATSAPSEPQPPVAAKPATPPSEAKAAAVHAASKPAAEGDRAKALLEGKPASDAAQSGASAAGDGRFVVQVGAFADTAKAAAVRQKLEKAGLKTYVHVAETKEGKRTRVRVGPFASRGEADKAAAKVKGLDLPASVLTL